MSPNDAFTAPRQPAATQSNSNPFHPSSTTTNDSSDSNNPFAVYDENVDEDDAETGTWETEATGTRSEARFWQPRFYASYFDINITDLMTRLFRSVIPFKPLLGWKEVDEESNDHTSVPDLYGPVWITTTLVLALSMGSKFGLFLTNVFNQKETLSITSSEFSKLWAASSILYLYVFLFPLCLTLFQCLFAKQSLNEVGSNHPIVGTVMVYGYSMTPVVVAAFVAIFPMQLVQIIAMAVAFSLGAFVIMLNLWRDVSVQHRSLTYFVRLLAVCAHAGVGTALVFIFFLRRS